MVGRGAPRQLGALGTLVMDLTVWAWRHPRPQGAMGRCIGQTDVMVDRRKAKRLAHRIRKAALRHGLPEVVYTSPLQRCAQVGQQLRRWGWRHRIDPSLMEAGFGNWDGKAWSSIPKVEVDAWVADFVAHRPGGGESLQEVLGRASSWYPHGDDSKGSASRIGAVIMVAHGGWMLARRWTVEHAEPPSHAHQWPAAPAYGELWVMGREGRTEGRTEAQYRPVIPAKRM